MGYIAPYNENNKIIFPLYSYTVDNIICMLCHDLYASSHNPESENTQIIGITGPVLDSLNLGQNPELLEFAALTGERAIVEIRENRTLAVTQENVHLILSCLPWLEQVPGATTVKWSFQFIDQDGNIVSGKFLLAAMHAAKILVIIIIAIHA